MKIRARYILLVAAFILQVIVVTGIDYYLGYEVRLGALYAVPVAFAAWYLGKVWGWLAAISAALLALWAEKAAGKIYTSDWIAVTNTSSRLAIFLFVNLSVAYFRRTIDLANRRMQVFRGVLPVCACCHQVDGGAGFWTDFPTFLRNNTQASVQFKTCPACQKNPTQAQSSSH